MVSILDRALNAMGLERRSSNNASGGDSYWQDFSALRTGPVNPATAQGVAAVYACVAAISETIAALPLHLYREKNGDRVKATDHPLYRVLHDSPNPEQTALEFRELMTAHVLLTGNAYARIETGWDGQVRALWPIKDVTIYRKPDDSLLYEYADRHGVVHRLLAHEVLHLRHRIGPDGVHGLSPIALARGVVELAQSEIEHGTSTFRNGARLSGILSAPGVLKAEQKAALRDSWTANYGGSANSGKTPVLEAGMTYTPIAMSLEDSEWVEARKLSVIECCRLFRVPPVIVGAQESANYSNSTEMFRQFVALSLQRWLGMWEQAISQKCLTEAGRRVLFAEHSVEGLLRGDSTTRAAFYQSGISAGWLLKSEARALENLPKIEGIDDKQEPTATPGPDKTTPTAPYPSKQEEDA